MSKTIKEERLRWILPIINKEMKLVDVAKICPYSKRSLERWRRAYRKGGEEALIPKTTIPKTSPNETPIWIKETIIKKRKETKLCAQKLHWRLKKEGLDIPENGFKLNHKTEEGATVEERIKIQNRRREFSSDIQNLCVKYHLDGVMWENTMDILVENNVVQEPDGVSLCQLSNVVDEEIEPYMKSIRKIRNYIYPIYIRISPYASQRDILDFIKKHYNCKIGSIKQLQEQYKKPNVKIGRVKTKKSQ